MYTQLYFHRVRRIYDIHLKDFMKQWLPGGEFTIDVDAHLRMTDNEVTSAVCEAASKPEAPGHDAARRITTREHFKTLYELNPTDEAKNPDSVRLIFEAAAGRFGPASVRRDSYTQKGMGLEFPVYGRDGRIQSSLAMSETL
jgi:HD superfamily phosphohydrolase